ncbi:hypothetical protein ACIBTV_21270 [Micromonospora sp. NPDC049366]|uniref:hypothetical protein n=1 Tax=Micromonospora sp. NPDC049366 TaxID=3364271 RepID=UPI00378E96D6
MSKFSFGNVFGDGGVNRGGQTMKCPCGNETDWVWMYSDSEKTEGLCGKCGRTVTIRDKR